MKHLLILLSIVFSIIAVNAQGTSYLNEKIRVESSFDLEFVMEAHLDKNEHCDLADGYRIQIVNSTNREEVYAKKAEVYNYFNRFKAYLVYDQPYYKLRIGDFQDRMEARKFLDEVIAVFPTAFIVMDEIKIK